MRNIVIIGLFLVLMTSLFAQSMLPQALPVRQGLSIEWYWSSVSIDEGVVYLWSDTRNGSRDLFAQLVDHNGVKCWGEEGMGITQKAGRQEDPAPIATSDGNLIITWVDIQQMGDGVPGALYAQKFNPAGERLWDADVIVCSDNALGINLVPDNAGGAYIAWNDYRISSARAIYMQHIDSDGNLSWADDGISVDSPGVALGSNTFWEDTVGGAVMAYVRGDGIYYSRFTKDDEIIWGPYSIADKDDTGLQSNPKIAPDGAGGFVVVWEYSDPDIFWVNRLKAQRISLAGAKLWGDEGVNVTGSYAVTRTQDKHRVVTADGGVIVAWEDRRNPDFSNPDIYVQKLNLSDGAEAWTAGGKALYLTVNENQENLRMTKTNDGGAVIVWEDAREFGEGTPQIYAQKIAADGSFEWGVEGKCLTPGAGGQGKVNVKQLGSNFALVWADMRTGSVSLFTQIILPNGTDLLNTGGISVMDGLCGNAVTVGRGMPIPLHIKSFENKSFVYWLDSRHGSDVGNKGYYQVISSDGIVLGTENGDRISDYPVLPVTQDEEALTVEMNPFGEMCIAWIRTQPDGQKSVFIQLIDIDGNKLLGAEGMELRADCDAAEEPAFTLWRNNGWEIYWTESNNFTTGQPSIYGQRIEGISKVWGSEGKLILEDFDHDFGIGNAIAIQGAVGDYLMISRKEGWNAAVSSLLKLDANGNIVSGWGPFGKPIIERAAIFGYLHTFVTSEHIVLLWIEKVGETVDAYLNSLDICIYAAVFDLDGEPAYTKIEDGNPVADAHILNITEYELDQNFLRAYQSGDDIFITYTDQNQLGKDKTVSQIIRFTNTGVEYEWGTKGVSIFPTDASSDVSHESPITIPVEEHNVVVWSAHTGDPNTQNDIFMSIQNPDGTIKSGFEGILINNHYEPQLNPRIASFSNGKVAIVWQDGVSSGKEPINGIYMQIVDTGLITSTSDITIPSAKHLTNVGNYPNPFNPETTISFNLRTSSKVQVDVFNIKGQRVRRLADDTFSAGVNNITWNGQTDAGHNVASGIYFYRVQANDDVITRKMVLMK